MRPFFLFIQKKSFEQKYKVGRRPLEFQDFPDETPIFSPARFARRDFRLRPSACPRFPGIFASDLVLVPDFPGADSRKSNAMNTRKAFLYEQKNVSHMNCFIAHMLLKGLQIQTVSGLLPGKLENT